MTNRATIPVMRLTSFGLAGLLAGTGVLFLAQCSGAGQQLSQGTAPPVAVIAELPADVETQVGDVIELDGSGSHPGEDTEDAELTFSWTLETVPEHSTLTTEDLVPVDEAAPSRVHLTPDVEGIFAVTLRVNNGIQDSDWAHLLIEIGGGNSCPEAHAGVDMSAQTGVPVTLDGSGSTDSDVELAGDDDDSAIGGDPGDDDSASDDDDSADGNMADEGVLGSSLTFTWSFSLVPEDSELSDSDIYYQGTKHPVIIPDVAGTYILQLRVDDGLCESAPDYVTLAVSNGNQAPIADAGTSVLLTPCAATEVPLDGSASYDPEGQPLGFAWNFTSTPTSSQVSDSILEGRFTGSPTFNWDVPGVYTLRLVVDDGEVSSAPDYVAVQAVPALPNGPPTASLGDDIVIDGQAVCSSDAYMGNSCMPCGERIVIIDALESTDPDNDPLNYHWDLQSGTAALLGTESDVLEVTLPEQPVTVGSITTVSIEISLTVYDCRAADDANLTITYNCEAI